MKSFHAEEVIQLLRKREEVVRNIKYLEVVGYEGFDYASVNGIMTDNINRELFEKIKEAAIEGLEKDIKGIEEELNKHGIKVEE